MYDKFFEVNVLRDLHEALLLLLKVFSGVNHIPVPSNNEITDNLLPDLVDFSFMAYVRFSLFVVLVKEPIYILKPFIIF